MSKFSKFSTKVRGILTVLALTAITFTVTSCKGKGENPVDFNKKYLTVDGYTATQGEVWEELQWDASKLFDDKAKEAIVNEQYEELVKVMKDSESATDVREKHTKRLQNYLVEAVYGFEFSLDDHNEEIENMNKKVKETKINQYADNIYKNYKVNLTQKQIVDALTINDLGALNELLSLYYLPYACELYAFAKLDEEIEKKDKEHAEDKDENTIGYFSKSQVVSQYKKDYLKQGDSTAVAIKFASQSEADATLKAFGIKVNKGKFCYLTNTENMNFIEYKKYYDEFDFNDAKPEDYLDIDAKYGHAAILQLYISMYNYVYPYHKQTLENVGVDTSKFLDQRNTTQNIINKFKNLNEQDGKFDSKIDEQRIFDITNAVEDDAENKLLINYSAEEARKVNSEFYNLVYSSLDAPVRPEDKSKIEGTSIDGERYSTSTRSIADGYYMVFKIYQEKTDNDKYYEKEITEDDLYQKIKNDSKLYEQIIQDLKNEDVTKDYISEKISEAMKDVKVKIFDKEIEISYAQNHKDYNKTLSGAPDKNTIAEFKYNDTVIKYNLTTEDGKGLWDILEYRDGTNTAVEIIQTKKIKDSKEYAEVKDEDMKLYEESLEYILASFANGGLAQQGYPAELGKYNFLMLYYHSADIDQIMDDIFRVANATAKILTNYSSKEVNNFFYDYSKRAFEKYFSITAKQVNVYLDIDENGKPDDIESWKNKLVEFEGMQNVKMLDIAQELYKDIYNKILASNDDHTKALQAIVDEYNTSGRFEPNEKTDNNYDPIPSEWSYAKYKKLGFNISIEDITVTNSDSDKDVKIKDKLNQIYVSEDFGHKDFFPSKYLENPANADALIEVDNKVSYFLITGANKPASAKYEAFKDTNNIYQNIYFMYNEKVQVVENVYNDNDLVNHNQIQAFVYEYLLTQTTNLVPSEVVEALNAFVKPVVSRYQSEATQQHISINYIANGDINNLTFEDANNRARYFELQEIAKRIADGYAKFDEKYDNYYGWFENVDKLIKGGNN